MTHTQNNQKHPRLFTHSLFYAMLLLIGAFVVINVLIIQSCTNRYLFSHQASMCGVTEAFTPFRHVLPVIYRPVELLESRGEQDRANLVVAAYSFSWGSFLVVSALMCIVAVVRVRTLSDQDRHVFVNWIAQHNRELNNGKDLAESAALGANIFLFLALGGLILAFWGFFSFAEPGYFSNMVHERNRDLYMPAIELAFTLLFFSVLINLQIKRYLSD